MNWTFGIVTGGNENARVIEVIRSIVSELPDAQVIIVGGDKPDSQYETPVNVVNNVFHVPFDEEQKQGWITRKKNLITEHAVNENICYLHDYVALQPGWLAGFEEFGYDWLTCMTKVQNLNGRRFRDWCVIYNNSWMEPPIDDEQPPVGHSPGRLLDYTARGHERWQYYSGASFCAKKEVMLAVPLNERRGWGQGEDVEWSRLVYKKYGPEVFQMNLNSTVKFLKQKEHAPWEGLPLLV